MSSSTLTSRKNYKNNARRFRNVEQFSRSIRSVQSSIVDTYENENFNRRNLCARNRIIIDWTRKWTLSENIRNIFRMVEDVSITCIVSWCVLKNLFENEGKTRLHLRCSETVYLKSHLLGHLTGLSSCILFGKILEEWL